MKLLTFIVVFLILFSHYNGYSSTNDSSKNNDNIAVKKFTDKDLLEQVHLRESKITSFQAYREEAEEVAIWALKNYARLLSRKPLFEVSKTQYRDMQIDLALTWARLAILYKDSNKDTLYKEYIQKSLDLTKELGLIKQIEADEKTLLNLIRRIDDSTKIEEL